ncbi:MAG: TIGR04086 family membrane protein [Dehalococcoidia bacterium]
MQVKDSKVKAQEKIIDVHWSSVWIGFGIAIIGTLILGALAFQAVENVWLIALGGELSLLVGGAVAALRAQTSPALNGAFIGLLYFTVTVIIIFGGVMTETLPDPLPGLPKGDSTFFFVWPLAQVLASTLGAVIGARATTASRRRKTRPPAKGK